MNKNVLYLESETLNISVISINFSKRDTLNIFYQKNNKTLIQTLEHPKYTKLNKIFNDKYKRWYDVNLGFFLANLKENGDKNYLLFLNKYGDNRFCQFSINKNLNDKGLYFFITDNQIKYVGRCTDKYNKRINQGYGKIHPKNCFIDGQATNCHLNSLINSVENIKLGIYLMTNKSSEEIVALEKEILSKYKFAWNIQKS